MQTKKSLGQHFLKSQTALSAMIDAGDPTPDDIILEIGPGEGVMTEALLKVAGKVIVIEKDHRLIPILQEKFKDEISVGKLDVLEKDVLDFDTSVLRFYNHPYKVIANIPYYITGQIIRMFLENPYQPESMTLLVQKEVAERIVAKDGKESLLSLSVKTFGTPKYVRTVGKGAFNPPPTVDSAIIHIADISKSRLHDVSEEFFFQVLHAGFAHKRKQLLPNLASLFQKEKLVSIFEHCGIELKARAEDIPLHTWVEMCAQLQK